MTQRRPQSKSTSTPNRSQSDHNSTPLAAAGVCPPLCPIPLRARRDTSLEGQISPCLGSRRRNSHIADSLRFATPPAPTPHGSTQRRQKRLRKAAAEFLRHTGGDAAKRGSASAQVVPQYRHCISGAQRCRRGAASIVASTADLPPYTSPPGPRARLKEPSKIPVRDRGRCPPPGGTPGLWALQVMPLVVPLQGDRSATSTVMGSCKTEPKRTIYTSTSER